MYGTTGFKKLYFYVFFLVFYNVSQYNITLWATDTSQVLIVR